MGVQTAFPGDDKVGLSYRLIEAGQIQNQVDAGTYVSVEKGQQASAQAAGGSGTVPAGGVAAQLIPQNLGVVGQCGVQNLDLLR